MQIKLNGQKTPLTGQNALEQLYRFGNIFNLTKTKGRG